MTNTDAIGKKRYIRNTDHNKSKREVQTYVHFLYQNTFFNDIRLGWFVYGTYSTVAHWLNYFMDIKRKGNEWKESHCSHFWVPLHSNKTMHFLFWFTFGFGVKQKMCNVHGHFSKLNLFSKLQKYTFSLFVTQTHTYTHNHNHQEATAEIY